MISYLSFATEAERQRLTELLAATGQTLDGLAAITDPASQGTAYDRHKAAAAKRSRRAALSGRDIGEIPAVQDSARRAAGERSFRAFCETYLSQRFTLAWSDDHLTAIDRIERSVRDGGLFALAMPRGNGKTTLAESAAIWTVATGLRRFVLLVGSTADAAKNLMKSIKTEIETNDLLAADWPEMCHPVCELEGIAHKARGQVYRGRPTHIEWGSKHIVFAEIAGAKCSQAIIKAGGLLGADVRGSKHKMSTGEVSRPDFIIPDDPQTDKSARSEVETRNRKRILNGALLGVAGPGKTIAGVMPVTVIRRGDLADYALDRKQSPQWHGERFKMLDLMPQNQKLLDEYAELRTAEMANGGDGSQATQWWIDHQEAIEAGGKASWPQRKLPTEASAIQHAINLRLDRGTEAFDAEFQNDPKDTAAESDLLTPEQITRKQATTTRGVLPATTEHVTAYIDVQDDALFWLAVGWDRGFGGVVIDYDVFPQFTRTQFSLADLSGHLERCFPGKGREARWHAAIVQLGSHLATKAWQREDGVTINAGKVLVDSGYGMSTDTVYEAVRACKVGVVQCAKGKFYGSSSIPIGEYRPKPGRRVGVHWFEDAAGRRTSRAVTIDTNFWKSFVQARLSTPPGDRGSLSLYQSEPYRHVTLSEHLTAEYRVRTSAESRGTEVDEWKAKPGRPDNHWLDCLTGCAVAASMLGLSVEGGKASSHRPKPMSFAELQRQAQQRRA